MTAPLYQVKNKFSEYVARAQKGEVIEVQKHGKPAVVIVDAENYYAKAEHTQKATGFAEWYNEWHAKYADVLDDEFSEILEKSRKEYAEPRKNACKSPPLQLQTILFL